jgi:hypothetical protein
MASLMPARMSQELTSVIGKYPAPVPGRDGGKPPEAILAAWHSRHVTQHLEHLVNVRDQAAGSPAGRLQVVLTAYALITHQRPQGTEIASLVHRGEHIARAEQQLLGFISDLIACAAQAGELRDDAAPAELASYCLHALTAAGGLPSEAAVRRLVAVTMTGLRPPG